jgi:hypothetical protein
MCKIAIKDGAVDLDSCPLLAGLSPDERRRKAQDPRLQACMARAVAAPARQASSRDAASRRKAGRVAADKTCVDMDEASFAHGAQMSCATPNG